MLVGGLEIELLANVARLQKDMDDAKRAVGGAASAIERSAALATKALGLLGGAMSLGAVVGMVKRINDGVDALNDLKDATGASIENISALEGVARRTGTSLDTVGQSLIKFNQALGGTKAGDDVDRVLQAIGLSAKQLKELDPAIALQKTAVALNQFADDGNKARAVQELFGKSLKEVAPLLKDVAEAGELNATVTTEQAEQAEKFNKEIYKMQAALGDAGRESAAQFLPVLTAIAETIREGATGAGSMAGIIGGALKAAFQTIAVIGHEVAFVFQSVGREIGGIAAQMVALASGNFKGFSDIAAAMREDALKAKRENDAAIARIMGADMPGVTSPTGQVYPPPRRSMGDFGSGSKAAAESEYQKITRAIREKIAAEEAEQRAGRELTEHEKFALKVMADVDKAKGKITATERQRITGLLEEAKAADLLLQINKSELALAQQVAQQRQSRRNTDYEQSASGLRDIQTAYAANLASVQERIKSLKDEGEALQMSARLNISLAEATELVTIARLEEKRQKFIEGSEGAQAIQAEIDKRRELLGLVKASAEADKMREIWQSIDRTAHDVFVNIFEGGSNAFKKLGQTLKASLLDLLYQMTVKKWIVSIGASVGGVGGAAASALGGGGGGGLGSLGGIGNMIGAGLGSFGSGLGAGFAALTGEAGIMGALSAGATSIGAGSVMAGLGTIAGALGPIAIGVAAIHALTKGKGGPKTEGGFGFGVDVRGDSTTAKKIGDTIVETYAAVAQAVGAKAGSLNVGAMFSMDNAGKGDALTALQAVGGLNGQQIYNRVERLGGGDGYKNVARGEDALNAAVAEESQRIILAALQATEGLSEAMRSIIGPTDAYSASLEEVAATLTRAQAAGKQQAELEDRLFQATATEAEKLARAREKELETLDPVNHALLRQVWAQEDLKNATDNGTATQRAAIDIAREREGLERQLLQLQGNTAELRRRELMELDPSNQAIQQQIWMLQDQQQAYQAAQQAAQSAAQAQQQYISALASAGSSIRDFLRELTRTQGGLASPETLLSNSRSQYESDLSLARGGDAAASARIAQSAQAFIDAQKGYTASGGDTSAVIARVISELGALPATQTFEQQVVAQLTSIAGYTGATVTGLQTVNSEMASALQKLGAELGTYFTTIDLNQDFYLTFDELKTAIGHIASDDLIRQLIAVTDANGDGMISQQEALNQTSGKTAAATDKTASATTQSAMSGTDYLPYLSFMNQQNELSLARLALMIDQNNLSLAGQRQLVTMLGGAPGFASGGMHSGGVRWVGENGPELEVTGPSRIFSASQSRGMVSGDSDLKNEVRALRGELRQLTATVASGFAQSVDVQAAVAGNTREIAAQSMDARARAE